MLAEFNSQFAWLTLGVVAQATILVCFLVHLFLSRRKCGFVLPSGIIVVCLIATAALAVYAAIRHDAVFLSGQFINLLIGLRILGVRYEASRSGTAPFPMVAPDAADADAKSRDPEKRRTQK